MEAPDLKGRKIILADDSFSALLLLKAFLQPTGAEVFEARNGIEVLRIFEKHPDVDLIILDIFMPEMNGLETVKRVREKNPKIPVIAQTAFVSRADKETCLNAGFSAYLPKPIDINLFYSTLWHFLG